jgi:hypothetical protein
VKERLDPRVLRPIVRHDLEQFRIDGMAQRLRLGRGGAKTLGPLLEFDADALDVDRLFVAVPGDALDADVGEVAAKAAVALDKHRRHARPSRADRRRESPWPAADDKDIGFGQNGRELRWLSDFFHGCKTAKLRQPNPNTRKFRPT